MRKDTHLESLKRLQHIEKAIDSIKKYVVNENVETFCNNSLVHDAVLFQFSVIGEAINHVEYEILEKYDYPWHKVRSFRNLISHEYFNVKLQSVWQTVQSDLPGLKEVIQIIIRNEF
jgi:uncharacterized protein with HEPN domain